MKTSEKTGELYKALIKAQGEMPNVKRNAQNPFTQSFYSDLGRVLETVRPVLSKHGLAAVQTVEREPVMADNMVKSITPTTITTRLVHESGEWVESSICTPGEPTNAQQLGSLITYLRRYSLLAICGTAPEDDDDDAMAAIEAGAAARDKKKPPEAKPSTKVANQNVTIQERMQALPKDLKDLMAKAGCNTTAQQFQLYKDNAGDLKAMAKACVDQLQKKAHG